MCDEVYEASRSRRYAIEMDSLFAMTKKPKYYVVWKGRKTGIFRSWKECSTQVSGYPDAEYKAFENLAAAETAFQNQYQEFEGKRITKLSQERFLATGTPILDSYAVDAACSGNPGLLEYRCVHTRTQREIFRQGPFPGATNNVGEFLAIVHALALCQKNGITQPIYSDSISAISWVRSKKCNTDLVRNEGNVALFQLIKEAEDWLKDHLYLNQVLKWDTEAWGEIPADFGRK